MKIIHTKKYIDQLKEIARRYHFPLKDIETVASIQKWCGKWHIDEPNPFRTGTCLRQTETGRFKILIAEAITPDMQELVVEEMIINGFADEVELLDEPFIFTSYLFLHEMARVKNPTWIERECDIWAFKELINIKILGESPC